MTRRIALIAGIVVLAAVWLGPVAAAARGSFAAHMTMHVGVVAIAAPLLAHAATASSDRLRALDWLPALTIAASLLDLVVIWAWHTPLAHEFARTSLAGRAIEQMSFLFVGLLLWSSVLNARGGMGGRLAGAAALLFTSMHMTLLGVLLGLAQHPICRVEGGGPPFGWTVMEDQQVGGMLMLGVGGLVFLGAGLALVGKVLWSTPARTERSA